MIRVSHLSFSYENRKEKLLDDVSFSINDGEYLCIVGENGCGKSTLLRLILGLLRPSAGTIAVDLKDVSYVPQGLAGRREKFPLTVAEMMHSYRRLLRIKDQRRVAYWLNQVGAGSCMNQLVGTLSGGQMQKVLIARALMSGRSIIMLDEPSTGVDSRSCAEIYEILRYLHQECGFTIVAVEHNMQAVFKNASQILHLCGGHAHLCSKQRYLIENGFAKPGTEEV